MLRSGRHHCGFTMIEILVALAIVAIALSALVRASGQTTANAAYLRERAVAMWVAENVHADLHLDAKWAAIGSKKGTQDMAGSQWHWQVVVEDVENETAREFLRAVRIEVRAREAQQSPSAQLIGHIGNPQFRAD